MKKKPRKLNISIIGCGRVANHHIRAINKFGKYSITGICDLDISKANFYGKKYKIPAFSNYRQMLEEINCDVVVIITPSGMHYEHSYEILDNYKKNVVIEKPIALKIDHVSKLFKIAKKIILEYFQSFKIDITKQSEWFKVH